ncbi:MAG: aldehyde dehydrogenase family protein [Tissierellia bacterium]|jgi:aldehyde dehydrogenase (NAD+)|nr:aldehyde dehydrogenase family protein [Tissierellia bacterium]
MNYEELYINGEWVSPSSKEKIQVENPATKEYFGSVPAANEEDVNRAVAAAKEAFKTWQFTPLEDRIRLLTALVEELTLRIDDMAQVIVKELGCGFKFARNIHVIPYIEDIKNYLTIIHDYDFEERFDEFIILKEPVGVVGALTPWNYPLGQIIKKLSPALLTGNTMVLKPSQKTPLVAFMLAEAIDKVKFPKGVFNLVSGRGSEVGNVLARHKDIDMITFTGSTKGGIEVYKIAAEDVKRVTLELGGKSASIILKGADHRLALSKTLDKMYFNTGQSCSAYSRLLVPREEKEEIEKLIIEMTKDYKFGDPRDPDTIIGPVASKQQFDKVSYYIRKGLEEGARLILGEVPKESKGYYIGPTVFTDVDNSMEIARNEIFGPVLCIIPYDRVEEAIEIANDSVYGLSGAIFGPEEEALDVARRIRTGTIVINHGVQLHKGAFGGYKHSGLGREGGKYGLEEFIEIKTMFINNPIT